MLCDHDFSDSITLDYKLSVSLFTLYANNIHCDMYVMYISMPNYLGKISKIVCKHESELASITV